ncbi:TonB dependent receptor [compost metagenome]
MTDQFSAFASIGYLNTKFLEFDHGGLGEQSGKSFPEAPEWTLGFGGRYEFENGVYVGADAKYTTEYNSRFGTRGMYEIDSRFIVNAQLGFKKDNWEITAFAENLTDEKYFTVVDPDAALPFGQAGQRRSFGVNLRAKF